MMDNGFPERFPPPQFTPPHGNAFVSVSTNPAPTVVAESELVDSVAAAEILGVTTNNLRQMVHKKKIVPVERNGRKSMFAKADVIALKERRQK